MAAVCLTTLTEQWIRDRLQLKHPFLGDVRTLSLPGTHEEKIRHLGKALNNFVRLKSLDLSYNAIISVEGLQHLKMLERLVLYYNCIPSLEKIKVLFELPVLRELDLRLNPLTKNCPHYRPHVVHAMPNLRKLDNCPVRDTERKAAILQFSSERPSLQHSSFSLNIPQDLSDELILNFVETTPRDHGETDSVHKEVEELEREDSDGRTEQRSSTPKQELAKSILRYPTTKNYIAESKDPQMNTLPYNKGSTSPKGAERPKVSFGPVFEKHRTLPGKQKQKDSSNLTRHKAKGHFTPNPALNDHSGSSFGDIRPPSPLHPSLNLSDPSNPILHPARLTYSSFNKTEGGSQSQTQAEKKKKGGYRKPLEMLLNLVDKYWRGERSLHHNNSFLSQAVQILSMMESDISNREAEVKTLRQDVNALRFQALAREDEHKTDVRNLSAQLEEACREASKLNEQLRIVLEENVTLQKQLIKLERQYLKSMMKSSPVTQIREAQTEVEELRKEIEDLRKKVQESEKVQELSNMLQESHRLL
ncbi:centrosomal protein of 72 kDa isoform X2 [Girardinichthys multiradiatus]|uniref:centrosomal protein of 72 kDa isoform X2 n=1 Tax=Girardinichthys multiradiatus TaxID=208333 RepID=UPI001FABFD70|nr:centrosomal protein of 72 kDa isoform X2 [Girardinichthys multiradiatus]